MHAIARKYGYDDPGPKASLMTHKDGHSISLNPHGGNLADLWVHTDNKGKKKTGNGKAELESHLANYHGAAIQHEELDMIEQFAEPEHMGNGFYFHGHGMDKNDNHRIKVSKGANRAFSVQTNQDGLFDVHKHYTSNKTAKMTEPIKRSILAHMFKWARKTTDPKRDHKEVEPDLKEKQFSEATPKKSDLQFTEFAEPAQYSEEVIKANISNVKPGTSCTPVGSIIMPVKMRDDSPPVPMQYQEKIEGSQFTIPSVVRTK